MWTIGPQRGGSGVIAGRRFRAPRDHRALLAVPGLAAFAGLLTDNRRLFQQVQFTLGGLSFAEFRQQAQAEALSLAQEYLQRNGEPVPDVTGESLLLSGHQPELSHPGVWIKNFALHGLAHRHGLIPLNLVVDNDIPKSSSIAVPVWHDPRDPSTVHTERVPFDRLKNGLPYEECEIVDQELWQSFPERVAELTREWDFTPMLGGFWDEVIKQSQRIMLIGEALVAARRAVERAWGCQNWEVPLSHLCDGRSFARFANHILRDLSRFRAIYNRAVDDYRERHGISNAQHPVPNLEQRDDWLEAPFWIWREGDARRGRLFVRQAGTTLELSNEERLPIEPDALIEEWIVLRSRGVKIRTRALTTTLFARFGLGEAFIHGIGGGKYDEVTDEIMRDFFGLEPPRFLVLSATLHLPLPSYPSTDEDVKELALRERDLYWNPQRHLDSHTKEVKRKDSLVREHPDDRLDRRRRYRELREVTEHLREFVGDDLARVGAQLTQARNEAHANAILKSREYASVLFPESMLREFLVPFAG